MLFRFLAHHELLAREGPRVSFSGAQGHFVGRPGRVDVELELRDRAIDGVWIIGQAVSIFQTELSL